MDHYIPLLTEPFSILLFLAGILTGFIGAMGGSGGLLLLPFMIAGGMSPALALGTARFAAIGAWMLASSKFNKAGHLRRKELPVIVAIAVLSGIIGTYLIIDIDEKYIYPIVGCILVALSLFTFIKKDFGLTARLMSSRSKCSGYLLYFFIMIYGGFFGAGASFLAISAFVSLLGFRVFQAHATQMAAWIVMSVFSSAIFIYHGQVNYFYALIIFISMGIGSYIGSHVALKGGDKWIKNFVGIFAFIVGLKLLIWP